MTYYTNVPIKHWAVEDRPREKLMARGVGALTDAELLAILLGTGTRKCSAIDLARTLLKDLGGLENLACADIEDLTETKGIGKAKAISLLAAFEIVKRRKQEENTRLKISTSRDAAEHIAPHIQDSRQEVFYGLYLNQNNEVKWEKPLFVGGVAATVVDPKVVFEPAVRHMAMGVIVAHNHPSGNLRPSEADVQLTKKLSEGARLFDMRLLDHLIISSKGFYSFSDEGLL